MPVEFIGMIATRPGSESEVVPGPAIDREYLRAFARAHEDAGFDRVLVGYGSSTPAGTQGSDHEQLRDGDTLPKNERYARTDEYLEILKRVWTAEHPIDFAGTHYRFEDFATDVRPFQQPRIPL